MENMTKMTDKEKEKYRKSVDIHYAIRFVIGMCASVYFAVLFCICITGEQDLRLNEGNDFGKVIDGATITQIKRVDEPFGFVHRTHYEVAYIDKEGKKETTNLYYTQKIKVEESSDSLCHASVVNGIITLYSPDKFESN
jgi:hypothetical protein